MASAALLSSTSLVLSPAGKGVPWRVNMDNSLRRTSLDSKLVTTRGIARKKGSFVTIASMIGRKAKKRETVIPEPDYRIPVVLLGIAGVFTYKDNLLPAATFGLLGLLLLFQTTRVRFVFDEEALVRLLHPEKYALASHMGLYLLYLTPFM